MSEVAATAVVRIAEAQSDKSCQWVLAAYWESEKKLF